MATTFTETTLSTTYKDDFRDSDNYHRILFNTGVGLQARELTQLQTILQKQIERFGNNVFKEGAVVKPGGVNINPAYEFIKLDETNPSHVLPDVTTLIGKTVTGQDSGIVATILEAVAASGSDPATLYVKYTNTSAAQGASDITTQRMRSNEVMDVSDGTDLKVKLSTVADPSTGTGTQVTLRSGIYYARGNFVFTQDQSKIISKYTDIPSTDIGFKAVEQVITASDDNALYDNQGSVPNVSAPGADRYKITLTIAERSEILSSENFIHVATVVNGAIFESVTTDQSYNIPNKLIATRIKENSGDYVVKPFNARFETDSQNTHLLLKVSDGTVVVDGYRADRGYPTTIRVAKPTASTSINNEPVGTSIGHFVNVTPDPDGNTKGIPDVKLQDVNLRDAVGYGGSTIGTAKVKAVTKVNAIIRMHLTNIAMNSGQAFRNVKSVGTSSSDYFNITLENSKAVLAEPNGDFSLFPLPRQRPKSITDLNYTAQRQFTGLSANASGVVTLQALTVNGEAYTQTDDFIFAKADSDITVATPTITLSGGDTSGTVNFGTSSDVATIASSSNIELISYVQKTQTTHKTKTLTTFNLTNSVESDGSGFKFINMKRADIFEVDQIVKAGDSSVDYFTRFILDNGQRPSRYEPGRLILRAGQSAPSGNVFVKYKFFQPSADGQYFSVNSYAGQIDYDKIPNYRTPQGTIVNLRNYIDFRSVADSAGNFGTTGSTMLELPKAGTTITADITYNLGVANKLVIDRNSNLALVSGAPSFNPQFPEKLDGTLPLFDIMLNPATLNDSDVSLSRFNYRRFTMKDIGQIEKRVNRLEEFTALNLLELDTKNFEVLDSAGNNRTKSGFLVDNFKNHTMSQLVPSFEYRASLDLKNHHVRPQIHEDQIRMVFDAANSVNAVKKGDNIYPTHDEVLFINQTTASKAIKINPFAVTIYAGSIVLSPSSDEWRDVERLPDKTIQGGATISRKPANLYDNYIYDWCGTTTDQALERVVTDESILTLVEDRVIESVLSHFMRARKVHFKASGLRPNTRVFTFLDGNNISSLTNGVGGHGGFQFYADSDTDPGNTLKNITVHPNGTSELVTDGDGFVSGSFIVPNRDDLKIRTGTRQFKILDISVDNEQNAAAVASAPYTASGFLDTKQAEYSSSRLIYRPYLYYGSNVGDNNTFTGWGYTLRNGSWVSNKPSTVSIEEIDTITNQMHSAFSDFAGGGLGPGQTGVGGYNNSSNSFDYGSNFSGTDAEDTSHGDTHGDVGGWT